MKKIISAVLLASSLVGCASLEWREVYDEENSQNLKIMQFSEDSDIEGRKSAGFELKFNSDEYKYPYKIEKFYHIIYMLGAQSDSIIKKIHSPYSITQEESHYKVVIEFKEKQSILDVIDYFYKQANKTYDIELEESVESYHWNHITNKDNKFYKVTLISKSKERAIEVSITSFDDSIDSLDDY